MAVTLVLVLKINSPKKEVFMSLVTFSTPAGLFTGRFSNFFKQYIPFLRDRADGNGKRMERIPAVNIMEDRDDFKIFIAVPCIRKEALQVHIEGSLLTVSAQPGLARKKLKQKCIRPEYDHSSFSRSISLPEGVHTEKIAAAYANGALTLILPKTAAAEAPLIRHVIVK